MRHGSFQQLLVDWTECVCALTMLAAWGHGPLVVTGILRPHFSVRSLRGWALVPPLEFGGTENFRTTPLQLERMEVRKVVRDDLSGDIRLRFSNKPDVSFELTLLPESMAAAPREVRAGRYLTEGGRRRPDPWTV